MTEQQHGQQPDEVEEPREGAAPEPDHHNPETEEDTVSGGPA